MEEQVESTEVEAPSEVVEGGTPSADSVEDASTATESVSTGPEFDWAAWDGKDEALPEDARFWASGVRTRVTAEYETKMQEAAKAQETYNAILAGLEDPRIKEMEEKVSNGEATITEIRTTLQAKEEAFSQLEAAYEELIESQASAEVAAFKAKFAETLADKKASERLKTLMEDEDFSQATLEELGDLVTMGEEDLAAVREIVKQENASPGFAARYVKATRDVQAAPAPEPKPAPKPNPTKKLVAGATKKGRPAKAVSGANKTPSKNLDDAILRAARGYFRN